MQLYNATVNYRLIYVFTIPDEKHEGCLKIGETSVDSGLSHKQLTPNCEELNQAARKRIDQYTKTALIDYELLHTELARRHVKLADGTEDWTLFSDNDVHNVLYASGYAALKFSSTNQDSEWFRVGLPLAKLAIQAVKAGRPALTAEEIASNSGETPHSQTLPRKHTPAKPFTLRRRHGLHFFFGTMELQNAFRQNGYGVQFDKRGRLSKSYRCDAPSGSGSRMARGF